MPYALTTFVKDWRGFCKLYYYDIMILFRMSLHYELRFSVTSRIRIRPILLYNALINNYWMRLSMVSWIIKTEICVICRSRRLRQITQTRGFDNSWYHAKTESNNSFIIHFSHHSSSETEAKRSAMLFLRRTLQRA